MAKYCFYCGRELTPGEVCSCRNKSDSASGKSDRPKGNASSKKPSEDPHKQANRNSGKYRQSSRGTARRMYTFLPRIRTFADQIRTLFPTITYQIKSGIQYFTRPVSKIIFESKRQKRPHTYSKIAVFSLLTALISLLMSTSGATLFLSVCSSIFGSNTYLLYSQPLISFLAISAISFLSVIILAACFYASARLSNRRVTFRKALDQVSISLVYLFTAEIILLLSLVLGSRGTFSLILIALLLMGITQFISFRSSTGLSEDKTLLITLTSYCFAYMLLKVLLFIANYLAFSFFS